MTLDSRRVLLAAAFALCVVTAAGLPAEQREATGTAAERLLVDFVALGSDGRPVLDLEAQEVTVRIDGRARAIHSLQVVLLAAATTSVEAAVPVLAPPYGTNVGSDAGRTFALVIDDDSFRPGRERPLRDAFDRFIAALASNDRVALVTMPYGGVKVSFTTEHRLVQDALGRIVGQAAAEQTGSDLACRTRRTLESLVGLLDTFGVRDEPATVMFVSSGLAAPRRDAVLMLAPGMCELSSDLYRQVGEAAGAARVHFYVIQPENVMLGTGSTASENIAGVGFRGSDNPLEGLEHLTGVTGGRMLHLTSATESALDRVLRESSTYYMASFDAQRSDRNDNSHQLEVRVTRPGVVVRSRPMITFPTSARLTPRPAARSPRDMLHVTTVFRDLPLRVTGYASQDAADGQVKVIALAEPIDPAVEFASAAVALVDASGKIAAQWTATGGEVARLPLTTALVVPDGRYRLRVAAIDTTGRAGTADYDLDAHLVEAGPLKVSSILLGLSRAGGFQPRMQFGSEPVAIGYVEIHGGAAGARLMAALELAATPGGPPIVAVPLVPKLAGAGGRYIATGAVPIGALPPGDYVVRALVGVEGQPMARIFRTLRKTR